VYKKISDGLMKLYGKSWVQDKDPLAEKFSASRDSLSKMFMGAFVTDFVMQHKDAFVGVYVLGGSGRGALNVDELENTLKLLSPKMQKTSEGEKLAAYIRGVRNTKIGVTIKNFVLNDPDGKAISFEQFKGKYVWIDFWASWCGPCKQAFPHMKELYAQYKDKGFEIVGVSTDAKIEPWLKILPKLNNPWPQLWDNKNIASEFAVIAFPTSFLIGPDGKIILKEVGYEPKGDSEMDKKLMELFGGKISTSTNQIIKDTTGKKSIPATQMIKMQ
jgi:thiol-disulfide isomerase/thioredoxin